MSLAVEWTPRGETLLGMGAPARIARQPFVAPEPWPEGLEGWSGEPWSVTLVGPVGTGKSMLAAELLYRMRSGYWIRAADLVSTIYGAERAERASLSRRYAVCRALVLDDFGHGHGGGATETVAEVIAARWDRCKPTIVTTNRRPEELQQEDAAAFDRLRDGLIVALTGRSRRGE